MTRPRRRILLAVALLAGAVGCAGVPEPGRDAREAAFEARQERLTAVTHWRASGRAGITTDAESLSFGLDWRQAGEAFRLELRAPMGAGSLRLQGDGGGVVLEASDGTRARAGDAGALLERYTGLDLPVEVLPWWLRGLPAPGLELEALELDGEGRVERLQQAGWTVRFEDYDARGGPVALPVRFSAEGPSARLRAYIRSWELDDPGP